MYLFWGIILDNFRTENGKLQNTLKRSQAVDIGVLINVWFTQRRLGTISPEPSEGQAGDGDEGTSKLTHRLIKWLVGLLKKNRDDNGKTIMTLREASVTMMEYTEAQQRNQSQTDPPIYLCFTDIKKHVFGATRCTCVVCMTTAFSCICSCALDPLSCFCSLLCNTIC